MRPEAIICSLCGGRHLPVQCALGRAIIESASWEPKLTRPQAEDIRVEAA